MLNPASHPAAARDRQRRRDQRPRHFGRRQGDGGGEAAGGLVRSQDRVADVNRILQVKMVSDGLQIVGIVVKVVAVGYLRRTAVPAPVVCDDPNSRFVVRLWL
jgi:hypothetical protein